MPSLVDQVPGLAAGDIAQIEADVAAARESLYADALSVQDREAAELVISGEDAAKQQALQDAADDLYGTTVSGAYAILLATRNGALATVENAFIAMSDELESLRLAEVNAATAYQQLAQLRGAYNLDKTLPQGVAAPPKAETFPFVRGRQILQDLTEAGDMVAGS